MARLGSEFKDLIRQKVDLASYIGRFVRLEKSGRDYVCCCPFHSEKTPSFRIYADGHYHCFGCHESGDIISFVMKFENHDYLSAIRLLADLASIPMPESDVFDKDIEKRKNKQDRLIKLMRLAALRYYKNLFSSKGEQALEYAKMRGLGEDLIKKFGLGYSLGKDDMPTYLLEQGFTNSEIVESSIGAESYGGVVVDCFAKRLIFPIINSFGNVAAFGGRKISEDDNSVKYYNSRATLLFDKSKTLFGLNLLKKKKQATRGVITPILVEGYMDVVALHSAGFDNAVASLGTSLTKEQARMLSAFSGEVIICYDGDAAGKKATLRGLDILKQSNLKVRVVDLEDGLDPDDYIKQKGKESFSILLDEALPLLDYKLLCARREASDKTEYARSAVKILAEEDDEIIAEEYLRRLEEQTGYTLAALRKQMTKNVVELLENQPPPLTKEEEDQSALFLLHCWYAQKPFIEGCDDIMPYLKKSYHRDIYSYLRECHLNKTKPYAPHIFDIIGEENAGEAGRLIDFEMGGNEKDYYIACVNALKVAILKEEKAAINARCLALMTKLKELLDEEKRVELLSELNQALYKLKQIDYEIRNGGSNE